MKLYTLKREGHRGEWARDVPLLQVLVADVTPVVCRCCQRALPGNTCSAKRHHWRRDRKGPLVQRSRGVGE